MKLQSAVEYLMTWGWAILIIAIVLGMLFEEGLLNPLNFYPTVYGGACHVLRPDGPLTTQFISLAGTCNSALPQGVAYMSCAWPDLSVCNPNFMVANLNNSINPLTISAWFWEPPDIFYGGQNIGYGGVIVGFNGTYPELAVGYKLGSPPGAYLCGGTPSDIYCSSQNATPGAWNYGVVTMSSSVINVYMNGKLVASGPGTALTGDNTAYVGVNASGCRCWENSAGQYEAYYNSGYTADVQIYNTTLSYGDVNALFAEGINGAPINLNNLVAWWQLNGNYNDYSGNGYNGNAINIPSTGSWKNTYVGKN